MTMPAPKTPLPANTWTPYQNLMTNKSGYDEAVRKANYYESQFRKGVHDPNTLRYRQLWANNAKSQKGIYTTAYNNWIKGGKQGALAAMTPQYSNVDSVLNKLLPFDPSTNAQRIALKGVYDQNLIGLNTQQGNLESQYATAQREFDQQIPQLARGLLGQYAGKGMAFSSGYGTAVGKQNEQVASQQAAMDAEKQAALANFSLQRGNLDAGYHGDIGNLVAQAVQNLSANAGSLNLTKETGLDINNSIPLLIQLAQKYITEGKY